MLPVKRSFIPTLARFFDDDHWDWSRDFRTTTGNTPSVNIRETNETYFVELAAPGMKKEDFQIEFKDNFLTIKSEQKHEHTEEEGKYKRREFSYQSFQRSFHVDGKMVQDDAIKAAYVDGILTIELPKREEAKAKAPRFIEIA